MIFLKTMNLLTSPLLSGHPVLLYLFSYTCSSLVPHTNFYVEGAALISFVLLVLALTVKVMFYNIWRNNSQKFRCAFYFFTNFRSCNKITVYLKLAKKFELKTLAVQVLFLSPFIKWHLAVHHLLLLQIVYIHLLLSSFRYVFAW